MPTSEVESPKGTPSDLDPIIWHHYGRPPSHSQESADASSTEQQSRLSGTSSGDSSVPRRIIRAIPDMRMFRFARRASGERRATQSRGDQAESLSLSLKTPTQEHPEPVMSAWSKMPQEEQPKKFKRQAPPQSIRLPDRRDTVSLMKAELAANPKSPFKEIAGFFKSLGDKTKRESTSSHRNSFVQSPNSSGAASPRSSYAPESHRNSVISSGHSMHDSEWLSKDHVQLLTPLSVAIREPMPLSTRPSMPMLSISSFGLELEDDRDSERQAASPSTASSSKGLRTARDSSAKEREVSPGGNANPAKKGKRWHSEGSDGSLRKNRKGILWSDPNIPDIRSRSRRKSPFRSEDSSTQSSLEIETAPVAPNRQADMKSTSAGPATTPAHRRGKFRGYLHEWTTSESSEDAVEFVGAPARLIKPTSTVLSSTELRPLAGRRPAEKDWYRVRLDEILDDNSPKFLDLRPQSFVLDLPDHLPTSPLCPQNPKNASGGMGICPQHGGRFRSRQGTLAFV